MARVTLASRSKCSVGYGERLVQFAHVVGLAAFELIRGMKARDLQLALETERRERSIGLVQELVVVAEVVQHVRMNQQRGLHERRVGTLKMEQLIGELVGETYRGALRAHTVTMCPLLKTCSANGHSPETDDRLLQPVASGGDHSLGGLGVRMPGAGRGAHCPAGTGGTPFLRAA